MIKNPELKIRNIRELRNLTQEYIANQLNISLRAYSKIESGETQLTIKRLNEISKILEISPIELLSFDEKNIFQNSSGSNKNLVSQSPDDVVGQLKEIIFFLKQQNNTLLSAFENVRTAG
ncbi:MAG TPA: helix-turn-helix transcriptional regulator [Flavobacterium sp.]|nr:helix-turn-helix transcriptional regulator [Flavobacterium sp.]